jgi:hypothetical protein
MFVMSPNHDEALVVERGGKLTAIPFEAAVLDRQWRVPEISDDRLAALMAQIQPACFDERGRLHFIKEIDPRTKAFTWDPTLTEALNMERYVELGSSLTYHSCGYYGLFKPSIAEVLAQVPEELLSKAVAFSTELPEHRHDLSVVVSECGRMHRAVTTWYGLKES